MKKINVTSGVSFINGLTEQQTKLRLEIQKLSKEERVKRASEDVKKYKKSLIENTLSASMFNLNTEESLKNNMNSIAYFWNVEVKEIIE